MIVLRSFPRPEGRDRYAVNLPDSLPCGIYRERPSRRARKVLCEEVSSRGFMLVLRL